MALIERGDRRGNISEEVFPGAPTVMVPAGGDIAVPELDGNLWHCPYTFGNAKGDTFFASLIYKGGANCIRCGRAMNGNASTSSTRICGSCDMGRTGRNFADTERYRKAKAADPNAAWSNVIRIYQFEDRAEWAKFKSALFKQSMKRLRENLPPVKRTKKFSSPRRDVS